MRPEVTSSRPAIAQPFDVLSSQAIADLALRADWERRAALKSGNRERLAIALADLDALLPSSR